MDCGDSLSAIARGAKPGNGASDGRMLPLWPVSSSSLERSEPPIDEIPDPIPLMKSRVLVLGGPGNISAWTLRKLLAMGHEVALYTRRTSLDPEPFGAVSHFVGDRDDSEHLSRAVREWRPDVVIDTICFRTAQADCLREACRGRVRQIIFVSTVDVYGYPLSKIPQAESDPRVPTMTEYAEQKKQCEQRLESAAKAGDFAVTVARPSYSFGTGFLLHFTDFSGTDMVRSIREGRPLLVPDEGKTLLHASVAANTGHMIARMAGNAACHGKAYNCAHSRILDHTGYLQLIGRVLGREPVLVPLPVAEILRMGGPALAGCPISIHLRENLAFSIDAFLRDVPDFEWEFSLEDGVRHFLEYQEAQGNLAKARDRIIDDDIIDGLSRGS